LFPVPNKTGQKLRISIKNKISTHASIRVYSTNGDLVFNRYLIVNEGVNDLEIPSLKQGLYVVEYNPENGNSLFKKFIQ
jgi:hypothetical protein